MTEQLFDMMKKLYWRKRWGDDVDHTPIEWRYYPYDDVNDDDDDDDDDDSSPIECGCDFSYDDSDGEGDDDKDDNEDKGNNDDNDDNDDNGDDNSPIECGYDHVATLPSCHPFPLPLDAADKYSLDKYK